LIKKIYEYGELYGADVALIIYQNGRYSTYRSVDKPSFPPSMKEIVGSLEMWWTCTKYGQMLSYPVPDNLLPHDVVIKYQRKRSSKQVEGKEKERVDKQICRLNCSAQNR